MVSRCRCLVLAVGVLQLEVAAEHFVPWQSLTVELFHERIRIKLFHVPHARLAPQSLEEHHCSYHGGHSGGVAYALHARFAISLLVLAVVVHVVSLLLAVLYSAYAAVYACFAVVVFSEVLWVGQYGFEELQRHYFHACGLS